MKKIFTIASVFALGLVITFACKKSTTTTPPATTSTSTTGPNTSVTSLTIDGATVPSLTVQAYPINSNEYDVNVTSTSSVYPSIYLTFPGLTAPASGTYNCSTYSSFSAPAANHCYLQDITAASTVCEASSGVVTVTTGTPNIAVFSGVVCTSTTTPVITHTLTGVFRF